METPFVFGKIATDQNFTDRRGETERLLQNFRSLTNTIIISPRRWGKSSLVIHTAKQLLMSEENVKLCMIDLFNVREEEEFYTLLAKEVLTSVSSKWEEIAVNAKNFLARLIPRISFTADVESELSFGIGLEELKRNPDDILDLAEALAVSKNIRLIICIDEFQNVANFGDSLAFQKKLRAHWQRHSHVAYCLFGSKRYMLMDVFANVSMPFYKFGDLMFLQKIETEEWIPFIRQKFQMANKVIERDEVQLLVELVDNHPYYVQQLAQQVWLRTEKLVVPSIVKEAYNGLIDQLSLLFLNSMETFSNAQLGFLKALIAGEKQLSSKQTLQAYRIGTSGNVVRIKQALMEREVIDLQGNKITFQDPLFEAWLKRDWFK